MLQELRVAGDPEGDVSAFLDDFDPHSAFFRTRYYNILEHVARDKPVIHSNRYDNGFSVVSRHALISKIVNNPDVFANVNEARLVPSAPLPVMIPVDANGRDHTFFRRALNPHLSPNRVAELSVRVKQHVGELVKSGIDCGGMDIVTDLGQPVTGQITMDILGLDREAWHDYADPIHNSAFSIGTLEARREGYLGFAQRIHSEVARLAKTPGARGLIAELARTEIDGRKITNTEIESIVSNLIIGGLDTTQAALSCVGLYLGRNPERRRELIDHPERIPNAVNEFVRVFSPAPMTGRRALEDIEVDGYFFQRGETALMFWAAANFDAEFVSRPLDIDFTREQVRLVSFAMGPHRCLGLHLAKMELAAFLGALLALAPDYRIVEEGVRMPEDIAFALAYLHVPIKF